jgi:uncharacterized surface protein with fasciclin (FAS1) repeats
MKFTRPLVCASVAASIALAGCAGSSGTANTLLGLASANPQLSQFAALAQTAGLGDMLSGKNPLTVFAPSNEAFKKLAPEALAALQKPENQQKLANVLKNHMLPGSISPDKLVPGLLKNSLGSTLDVAKDTSGRMTVNGANVVESIKGENGYVHVVDQVLMPQS